MDPIEELKKPKRMTPEQRDGNRLFRAEVKRMGVKGFVAEQVKMAEDKKKDAQARADAIMDENLGPYVHQVSPRFGFSHIPAAKWDSIFGKREDRSHAQD